MTTGGRIRRHDDADRLHSAAIRLLRGLRRADLDGGVSAARLSALSVLVFAGPQTVSGLADLEQVRPPTASRLLKEMERQGLVNRTGSKQDARLRIFYATTRGRRVLETARQRRVQKLHAAIATLSADDSSALARAMDVIEKLARTA